MKDPQRLLDSGSAFERDLLSSSHDEMPSKDLDRRVIAAMAGVPLAGAATAPSLARWLSTKSVIAGIAVVALGALVVGGMLRHEAPSSSQSQAQAQAPAPAIVARPTTTTTTPETPPEAVITPDALPNAAAPPRTVAKAAAGPSAPSPAPTASASIAREIELLDDVRAKLGAGTPSEASRALDAYDREFPQGTLRPEATVLRIRTLLLTGERARAEKLGSELIAKNPNGVHAKRVRALLEEK
jgi:hypothetical protein